MAGVETMADDPYARIAQLEAENAALRERDAASQREVAVLRDDNQTLGEQQAATAEVLRVIASSPQDLQAVLDQIVDRAAVLCGADNSALYRPEGDTLRRVAWRGEINRDLLGAMRPEGGPPISPGSVIGSAFLERRQIQVDDLTTEFHRYPMGIRVVQALGTRTILVTPLLAAGEAVGALTVYRREVAPFDEAQRSLLRTFAAQAVIAIENARLFSELEQRTTELEPLPRTADRARRSVARHRIVTDRSDDGSAGDCRERCQPLSRLIAVASSGLDGDTLLWMANLERQPDPKLSLGQRVPLADYNLERPGCPPEANHPYPRH